MRELLPHYDTFIFGIEGVLHEGTRAFPEALNALLTLRNEKKSVILLTNLAQRIDHARDHLAQKGITPALYQYLVTAGEELHQNLLLRIDPWHGALGNDCYFIGSVEDQDILYGLELHCVRELKEADFILVMGKDEWHDQLEDYYTILEKAAQLSLKMICANSNLYIYEKAERQIRPGAIGQLYEKLGGEVYYHGKPYPAIYNQLLKDISPTDKSNILAIGDSLTIDIQGAISTGFDTLLTLSPYTYDEFALPNNLSLEHNSHQILDALKRSSIQPTFLIDKLLW